MVDSCFKIKRSRRVSGATWEMSGSRGEWFDKNKIKTVFLPGQLTSSSAHASLSLNGLCKSFWTVRLNPMSMKDKIDSSGVFPWSFPIQQPLYIMCLVSRFTENFECSKGSWKSQKEQVTVSEESSCHSSPLATSHPDARDACQTLNSKMLEIKQEYPPDSQRLHC